jgi:predicted aspartyl protease
MSWRWCSSFLAAAIALFVMVPRPAAAAGTPDCPLSLVAALPIKPDIGGRPLVPVKVDGREKLFLVDTGGIYTMLTHAAARDLALPQSPLQKSNLIFVNGDAAPAMARAQTFHVGPMAMGQFNFLVTPPSMRLPGAAGAIGPDILRRFDVELDFVSGRLNLFSQSGCGRGVVYWTKRPHTEMSFELDADGHMMTVAMLNGRVVDVLIDTGAVATTMMLEDATQEFGITPASPGVERIDDRSGGDRDAVYAYRFASLELEGMSVPAPSIVIRPDQTGLRKPHMRPELILGMSEMAKLRLYISYRDRKIYMTGAEHR